MAPRSIAGEAWVTPLYEKSPLPIYLWRRAGDDFVLVDCNDAAREITRGRVAELVGGKASEIYHDRLDICEDLSRSFLEKSCIKRKMSYRLRSTGEIKQMAVTYAVVPPDHVIVYTEDLTDRKHAEEQLAHQANLLANVTEAIIATNEQFVLTYWNRAAEAIYGWKAEEVLGRPAAEVLRTDSVGRQRADVIRTHMETGRSEGEVVQYRKNGLPLHVEARVIALRGERGQITGYMSVHRDLSERMQVEEELKRMQTRFSALIESTTDSIWCVDGNYRMLAFNIAFSENFQRVFGTKPEVGMELASGWLPEEVPRWKAWYDRALAGERFSVERSYNIQGETVDAEFTLNPVITEQQIAGVAVFAKNITLRKRAEAALRATRERLAFLLLSSPAVTYSCCLSGDYACTYVSENVAAQLGYEPQEFTADPRFWVDRIHPEDAPRILAGLPRLFETGYHVHEYRFRHKDGSCRWMHDELKLVRNAAGNPVEAIGFWTDITERKRTEKLLAGEKQILELISRHTGLNEVLGTLCQLVEDLFPGLLCSVSLLDADGKHFRACVAPSLPETYKRAIDCVVIGPHAGSCGAAAYRSETVIVRDIAVDTLCEGCREVALDCGLRACWSAPIRSAKGYVLGTFTLYYREPREPSPAESELIDRMSHLAGTAIEHTRALEELRLSEERYRLLFKKNPLPAWVADAETLSFLAVNEAAVRAYGYSREEFLSMTIKDIHPAEAIPRLLEYVRNVKSDSDFRSLGPWKHRRKDGTILDVEITGHSLTFAGRPAHLVLAKDITEQRRAEQEVKERTNRLNALIENNPLGIVLTDSQGRVLMCNPAFERLFLYHHDEIQGAYLDQLICVEETRSEWDRWAPVLLSGEAAHFTSRRRRKNGKILDVGIYWVPLMEGAELVGSYGLYQDISERKRTEKALQSSEKRYRELIENANDIIYTHDLQGKFTSFSTAGERLTGYRREEIASLNIERIVAPEYQPLVREMILQKRQGRGPTTYELEIIAKDGRRIALEVSSRLVSEQGKPVEIQGIARDITERQQARRALREFSRRLIESQDEERRRISRELHDSTAQNLAALVMHLGVLKSSAGEFSPAARDALSESLLLAKGSAEEIRTLSYLLHPPILDESGLPSALRWYVEGFVKRSGMQVEADLPSEFGRLPAEAERTLFRIAQESLTNVHLHSGSKGARIQIARHSGEITMEIKDEGRGIPPEVLEALKNGGGGGLGVGIPGMRERARQLGGDLEIVSDTAGTLVRVILPLAGDRS